MDHQQQQRINRAAQEFADALVAAYKTTSDSTVVAQQLGAQQIEYFFDTVINNLRTQAEGTLQVTQQLTDQQEFAREATRDLAQTSTDNYMDLLDSMFSFYQGVRRGPRGAPSKRSGESRKPRQERRKPRYALRRPKGAGAKPKARGTLKRVRPTPRRFTARRASGCGAPAGLRSGVGTPDLGDGPHVEDRVKLPSANAQGAERAWQLVGL